MWLCNIMLSFLTTGFYFCPQSLLNLHSCTSFFANRLAIDFLNTSRVKSYWQWKENSGQLWEGSLHVFPAGLSVSMLLSAQLIIENSRLFSQDPQHTATHSDGVTQTSTTEPPLSEAEHTARPGPQLVRILVEDSASLPSITDIWGCVHMYCHGCRFLKSFWKWWKHNFYMFSERTQITEGNKYTGKILK